MTRTRLRGYSHGGFTLLEGVVVLVLIAVLAALALPIMDRSKYRQRISAAATRLKNLGAGASMYMAANNGELPQEGSKSADGWSAAADPENANAWYNAIPKLMNRPTAGDFANSPREFYTKDNFLYFPWVSYPKDAQSSGKPLFAVGINSKLQQTDPETGKKPSWRLPMIGRPSRTLLFLERGLPGEAKGSGRLDELRKAYYDGSPKADAKSFVGRYGGKGFVVFVDGHIEEFESDELLSNGNGFPPPSASASVLIWRPLSKEDPNK